MTIEEFDAEVNKSLIHTALLMAFGEPVEAEHLETFRCLEISAGLQSHLRLKKDVEVEFPLLKVFLENLELLGVPGAFRAMMFEYEQKPSYKDAKLVYTLGLALGPVFDGEHIDLGSFVLPKE